MEFCYLIKSIKSMLNRASIFANHNNNKKIPMKTLCLSSNVVQTDKTFENNYKTKKNWHKGRAMANQNKKYLAKFSSYFCEFLWKPIEPINFTEWYEERKRFPIRIELAGSKNAEKNDLLIKLNNLFLFKIFYGCDTDVIIIWQKFCQDV